MNILKVNILKGLYTEVDETNNLGAVDLLNVNVRDTLSKSKGFELVDSTKLLDVSKTHITEKNATMATVNFFVASADTYVATGDVIGLGMLQLESDNTQVRDIGDAIQNSYAKVTTVDSEKISIDYAASSFAEVKTEASARYLLFGDNLMSIVQGNGQLASDIIIDFEAIVGVGEITDIGLYDYGTSAIKWYSVVGDFTVPKGSGYWLKNNKPFFNLYTLSTTATKEQIISLQVGENYIGLPVNKTILYAKDLLEYISRESDICDSVAVYDNYYGSGWITYNKDGSGVNFPLTSTYLSYGYKIQMTSAYNLIIPEYETLNTIPIFTGIKKLHGFTNDIVKYTSVETQGSYHDKTTDILYTFISNKDTSESYLIKSDKDTNDFEFVEGSSTASCTAYGVSYEAEFVKYENDIIFTKNEKKLIASAYGGVHYIDGADIKLYGQVNNPTGATIEVFEERINVGDISYEGNTAVNGGSWLLRSKMYPEKLDTEKSIATATFASNGDIDVMKITSTSHGFVAGSYIFIDNMVHTGNDDINQKYYKIETAEANTFTVYLDTKGHGYTSGGTVILRGNNWLPSTSLYIPDSVQAGVIRCDDNDADKIVKLKKSFTSLVILRQRNPYILIEGEALAKQLNIEYGTVSNSVAQSANGVYFVSQYGLSNVVGTSIKQTANALDNITANLTTASVKRLFSQINVKSEILLNFSNDYIWLHDRQGLYTLVLDTTTGEWTRYYGKLAESFFSVNEDIYSVYKGFIFKHEEDYTNFSISDFAQHNYTSRYKTRIYDMDEDRLKEFAKLYMLIKGVASSNLTSNIGINLYYNGQNSIGNTLTYDIKTGTDSTWLEFLSASDNWLTALGAIDTWGSLLGSAGGLLEKGNRRLGFGRQIQFELSQNAPEGFSCSDLKLYFNVLEIE